ncbi:MAG: SpoIIE family protein phosphatase, partial [Oscillospiraceae bacterium]|nr:SpoIIE family protein phosphatase [Oscillospiraceae bacterium]
ALTLAISLILIRITSKTMAEPIKKLSSAADKLVREQSGEGAETSIFNQLTIRSNDEVGALYESLKQMEHDMNAYIRDLVSVTAEKERIGAELNVATQIQADMLPRIFPAFPERKEFDIYASMTPAKEVGGDFYDFFLIDNDHLGLVMADVSGKGVPAALFMVIAKTLIKNQAQTGEYSPAKVLVKVNEQLCEGNEAELFVTVWLAILEISTGKGLAANAGHEHPTLRRSNGKYELVEYRHSPAVATMDCLRFREHEFELRPGDSLFVYTDGVAEATNANNELYGTERMLAALNEIPDAAPEIVLEAVKRSVDAFVGDAPQFDDITMLCLKYLGADGAGGENV